MIKRALLSTWDKSGLIEFAGGLAADSTFFNLIPWLVVATFVVGLLGILYLRARRPEVYQAIGRTVYEETHERV